MHKFIEKIKKLEQKPFVKENFFNTKEIDRLIKLYLSLPIEIDNKRQKIIKKKWTIDFSPDLQNIYKKKLNTLTVNITSSLAANSEYLSVESSISFPSNSISSSSTFSSAVAFRIIEAILR